MYTRHPLLLANKHFTARTHICARTHTHAHTSTSDVNHLRLIQCIDSVGMLQLGSRFQSFSMLILCSINLLLLIEIELEIETLARSDMHSVFPLKL